jgi:hypothetical protein
MAPTTDQTRFIADARLRLPGALDAATQQVFFNVADEFLKYTNVWQERIPFSTLDTTTTCLLHLNGPDFSTQTFPSGSVNGAIWAETWADFSGSALTFTPSGRARISQSQYKFGGSSANFDGNASFISTPITPVLQPTGDFTIDFWSYLSGVPGAAVYGALGSVDGNFPPYQLRVNNAGNWIFAASSAGSSFDIASNSFGVAIQNVWQHIAIVRSGNTFYCFLNGVLGATITNSSALAPLPGRFTVGASGPSQYWNGYIDEVRFSTVARDFGTGIAGTNFTPPTQAYVTPPSYSLSPFESGARINRLMYIFNSSGVPQYGSLTQPGNPATLTLQLLPSTLDTFTAIVSCTTSDPADTNNWPQFPSWIFNKYRDEFLDGIWAKMMAQPAKPYANERMAVYHARRWEVAKGFTRSEVQRQNTYRAQGWFFPRGWGTRRQKFTGSATSFY